MGINLWTGSLSHCFYTRREETFYWSCVLPLGMERTWTVRVKAAANQTPSLWHHAPLRTHWTATRWEHTHRAQKWCPDLLQLWALKTNVIWSKGLSDGLVFHSSPAAVSWLWSYTTLWPATATSWRCGGVRLWRSWSAVTTNQTGAWSGPQTALLPRRAWCPALCSASPIPGPPWRWKASSITKVQKCNLICFTGKKSLIWWSVENPSLHPCCHGNTHISEGTVNAE